MISRTVFRSAALAGLVTLLTLGTASPAALEAQEPRLSPLDSVTAVIEGADIAVQYGRPSMRERTIYGGLVPYDAVWRTGANEATHIRTSADLKIGNATIPAGHYTLYTLPGEEAWSLIVNKQTGQWGTEYDAEQDLVRLPMTIATLEEPVEMFTITVEETEGGGVLALEWEATRAYVTFEVAESGSD
jgi:hypothetical protein